MIPKYKSPTLLKYLINDRGKFQIISYTYGTPETSSYDGRSFSPMMDPI